jgi:hypothetical protein
MKVRDILEVAVPARSFLPKAKLGPLEQREVNRLKPLHAIVQRDFVGAKKTNARGPLADYMRDQWLPYSSGKPAPGFLPAFTLCFPDTVHIDEQRNAHITTKGIFLDGESRGESLLMNIERLSDTEVEQLLEKQVSVQIVHGIQDPKVVAKYFADVNGKGVGVNPNLMTMADYTDPYAEVTKRVFESLGLELETRQRQVPASSEAVMTGLQARLMIAAIAKGIGAVQYGGKTIPADGVDFDKLEDAAQVWLGKVFARFSVHEFRDRDLILRSVPVTVSFGALGKAFYDGDATAQETAMAILADHRIDWVKGPNWTGVAGKVNANTMRFAVGGGKEYAYATYRALSDPDSHEAGQIRSVAAVG